MKKLLSIVFALSVLTAGIFAQDATTEFAEKAADFSLDAAKKTAEFAVDQTKEALKDVEFPTGTWTDSNWNADWVMDVAKVHLYDSVSGELIYTFTKDNTENFKFVPSKDGVSLTFTCKETHRSYKITKPLTLDKDLQLFINPDWTDEDYNVTLKFKSLNVPANN